MSYNDFCQCRIDEFRSIADTWQKTNEAQTQDAWERTRILAAVLIQPHTKKAIKAQNLIPLPWDKPKPARARHNSSETLSMEERRARMAELAKQHLTPDP